jgi:hypothetical protein
MLEYRRNGLGSVGGLRHDRNPRSAEDHPESAADQRLIVRDHYPRCDEISTG